MKEKTYYCSSCQYEVPESQLLIRGGGFSVPYGEGQAFINEGTAHCPYCQYGIEV